MKARYLPILLLAGCASVAQMEEQPPSAIYHSASSRDQVAECLLDRVSSGLLNPAREVRSDETVVSFTSAGAIVKPQPAIFVFTIRDAAGGSAIEVRRLGKTSLANAETCF